MRLLQALASDGDFINSCRRPPLEDGRLEVALNRVQRDAVHPDAVKPERCAADTADQREIKADQGVARRPQPVRDDRRHHGTGGDDAGPQQKLRDDADHAIDDDVGRPGLDAEAHAQRRQRQAHELDGTDRAANEQDVG